MASLAAYAIYRGQLRLNFTPSMPVGIYRIIDAAPVAIQKGEIVAVCPPPAAAELGRRRGYLLHGRCPGDVEMLLKTVAATAGDVVDVQPNGMSVNGRRLPHSRQLTRDQGCRRMMGWPAGHHSVERSTIWLYGANDRSWDSRYWGQVSLRNVSAILLPLFVITIHCGTGPVCSALRAGQPACGAVRYASPASSPAKALQFVVHSERFRRTGET